MRDAESANAKLVQGPIGHGLIRNSTYDPWYQRQYCRWYFRGVFLAQVGTEELAAYSFTFPVTSAVMSLSLGISISVSSVLAELWRWQSD